MIENVNQVVLLLIVATVLFSMKGFNNHAFFEKYKFQVTRILNGEKIRMLTSGFLHADWLHLGFNMYALYLFGDIVAYTLGNVRFLFIYFGSLIMGSFYSLTYHKKEAYYSAVGSSGAVSGVVYSCIMIYPQMDLRLLFIPIDIPGYIFGVAYLLYSIYGMKNSVGNIGHSAHLGGTIGGFAITLVLFPKVFQLNPEMIIALSVPILILIFFGKRLKI